MSSPTPAPHPTPASAPASALAPARSRLDVWKEKLLDLSLRNRLIHFTPSRAKSVELAVADLAVLEDRLAQRKSITFEPAPPAKAADSAPPDPARAAERVASGRVATAHSAAELKARLLAIHRQAKTEIDESGASTLFLALGVLRWFEADSDVERRAPILLVPVKLARRGAELRFELSAADDEPRLNDTLLEKLRLDFGLDFGALREVPRDESGVDVNRVLAAMKDAVSKQPRFEVLPAALLGFFSFAKFLLWRDLHEHKDLLLENDLVRHLVVGDRGDRFARGGFLDEHRLDRERPASRARLVLDADSSQEVAIAAALAGRSFVLQGPPGTGKSQTIANVIAELLAAGKRVLFVAEKRAALEVVAKRLAAVGLADACLELHSNKTSKKEVVLELARTLDAGAARVPADRAAAIECTEAGAARLSGYAERLHEPAPIGMSHFECVARRLATEHAPKVALAFDDVLGTTAAKHAERLAGLDAFDAAARELPSIADHPFAACSVAEWTPALARTIEEGLVALESAATPFSAALDFAAARLGIGSTPTLASSEPIAAALAVLANGGRGAPAGAAALLARADRAAALERLDAIAKQVAERDAARAEVLAVFRPEVFTTDLAPIRAAFDRHADSFAPSRWFALRSHTSKLAPLALAALPEPRRVRTLLSLAARATELDAALDRERPFVEEALGANASASDAGAVVRFMKSLLAADGDLARRSPGARVALPESTISALPATLLAEHAALVAAAAAFRAALDAVLRDLRADADRAFGAAGGAHPIAAVVERARWWRAALPQLRPFTRVVAAENVVRAAGLAPLADALRSGALAREQMRPAFERAFFSRWVDASIELHKELRGFDGREHERVAAEFAAADRRVVESTGAVVAAAAAALKPELSAAPAPESDLGILRRESLKKRAHWPIRRLLERAPGLVARLKPCFLMSPLSIAQFLPASAARFDLVIFDEASQITTWDAIGAVARGKQVIVVGDSKQLPPTQFFSPIGEGGEDGEPVDDDQPEDVPDLDSILKECEAVSVPSLMLRWHYRSKDERLIAFSNARYYDNRLSTFPCAASAADDRFGVRLVPVAGAFDRGGDRTNRAEAEAIVAWIVAALKDPARRTRSIGVVTFNLPQQTLIEDLLDDARGEHPEIEPFFHEKDEDGGVAEPVFVKNLENVQGDERDVMLFSITYGPDADGKLWMNFGPLNAEGGERRLNVAVTRARELLLVFSTLRSEQIDVDRARGLGVQHLKEFLHYAEVGPTALAPSSGASGAEAPATAFEDDVAAALTSRGIAFDRQLGCSGYRLDFAVKDAANPGRYLLAIECDGKNYWSGATARDRDRLRREVLERLGWSIHRVWSTDWHHDKDAELARIEQAIARAKDRPAPRWPGANADFAAPATGAIEPVKP